MRVKTPAYRGIFESDKDRIIWKLKCVIHVEAGELGQVECAKILGTSQSHLSRALNPEYKPKIDTLLRWVKKLGYSVEIKTRVL